MEPPRGKMAREEAGKVVVVRCAPDGAAAVPEKASERRRCACRSAFAAGVLAGVLAPLLVVRVALLAVEAGGAWCPAIHGCLGWRVGIGPPFLDSRRQLSLEQRIADYLKEIGTIDPVAMQAAPGSLDELLSELQISLSSLPNDGLDVESLAIKMKAMLIKTEWKVRAARRRALFYQRAASTGIPKSLHCLTLRLAEEYSTNAVARAMLPAPEHAHRLVDPSYLHIALMTDNPLAAAVAVSSVVSSSDDPANLVFHVITDRKGYAPMHSWFALHPVLPAALEVKGLHQFEFPNEVAKSVAVTVREIRNYLLEYQRRHSPDDQEAPSSAFSMLSYLRIHLPEFLPKLNRVILLDDDVVIRKDLTEIWTAKMNAGSVIAAVGPSLDLEQHSEGRLSCCVMGAYADYLNLSDPATSSAITTDLSRSRCAWSWGVSLLNLDAWRQSGITESYKLWIRTNLARSFSLWKLGSLPPALLAFTGRVQPLDRSWHLSGLGWRQPDPEMMNSSEVLHFSGPRKPWLDIGFPEARDMWRVHLNGSDELLRECGLVL